MVTIIGSPATTALLVRSAPGEENVTVSRDTVVRAICVPPVDARASISGLMQVSETVEAVTVVAAETAQDWTTVALTRIGSDFVAAEDGAEATAIQRPANPK